MAIVWWISISKEIPIQVKWRRFKIIAGDILKKLAWYWKQKSAQFDDESSENPKWSLRQNTYDWRSLKKLRFSLAMYYVVSLVKYLFCAWKIQPNIPTISLQYPGVEILPLIGTLGLQISDRVYFNKRFIFHRLSTMESGMRIKVLVTFCARTRPDAINAIISKHLGFHELTSFRPLFGIFSRFCSSLPVPSSVESLDCDGYLRRITSMQHAV